MTAPYLKGPWKFASSVDGDFVAVYPDTGKMEFPIAVKPSIMRGDVWNEIGPLIASAPALLEALRGLAGNAGALRAFEWEIRAAAGNTNWQCLMDAVAAADAAIASARGAA